MKQILQTHLGKALLCLLMVVLGGSNAWGETETITFSNLSLTNGVQYTSFDGSEHSINFSLEFGDGANDGKYYNTGTAIRVYAGGHMTVTSSKTITGIVLTFGSGDGSNNITTDIETYSNGTWTGNANSVTFTVGGSSGHRRIASVAVTYASVAAYTITAESNNESYGTVSLMGTTITATPKPGYRVSTSTPYTVTGTATVSQTGNEFAVTPSTDCTVQINFEAIPTHNAIFSVNGITTSEEFTEGESITFPDDPADADGKTFVGWVAAPIIAVTDKEPDFITSASMSTRDVTFYAVFASENIEPGIAQYTLDYNGEDETISSKTLGYGSSVSYTATDGGTWVIKAYKNQGMQINTGKNSSIKVPICSGNITTINVIGGASKAVGFSASDYNGSGTITYLAEGTDNASQTLDLSGKNVKTGYIVPKSGNIQITKIVVNYEASVTTYSSYCTDTKAIDTREFVNLTDFTATATTLLKSNNTTTTITNDQDGWTAAYTYTSSDESVATVSNTGVITAVAKGTATITATINVDENDVNYKAGNVTSKSIVITVNNPSHTVAFYANGTKLSESNVEEETDVEIPATPTYTGFTFAGWATSTIDGKQVSAPDFATISTMGTSDVTYYAVYAESKNVIATFNAADISNLTETATRTWTDNATGLVLYINYGQHYTTGTPKTFTVNSGAGYYFEISGAGKLNSIVTTISEAQYKINEVTNGASLATSTTTQTITFTKDMGSVRCYAQSNKQIRATQIVVDAVLYNNYYTTLTQPVSVTTAGYATFCSNANLDFKDSAIKAYVGTCEGDALTFSEVTKVPARTGLLLVCKGGATENIPVVESAPAVASNCLTGVTEATTLTENDYILNVVNGGAGFYKAGEFTSLAANRAYIPAAVGGNIKSFGINLTTGIDLPATEKAEKVIFDLSGRRVEKPAKGLYIVNGKKVLF